MRPEEEVTHNNKPVKGKRLGNRKEFSNDLHVVIAPSMGKVQKELQTEANLSGDPSWYRIYEKTPGGDLFCFYVDGEGFKVAEEFLIDFKNGPVTESMFDTWLRKTLRQIGTSRVEKGKTGKGHCLKQMLYTVQYPYDTYIGSLHTYLNMNMPKHWKFKEHGREKEFEWEQWEGEKDSALIRWCELDGYAVNF